MSDHNNLNYKNYEIELNSDSNNDDDDDDEDEDGDDVNITRKKRRKYNNNDDDDDNNNDGRVKINLDKTLIPKSNDKTIGLAFNNEKSELDSLGIVSYQHSIYEEQFVDQIEKNVDKFFEKQNFLNEKNDDEKLIDNCDEKDGENSTKTIEPSLIDDDDDDEDDDETNIIDGPSYIDNLDNYFDDDVDRFLEAPENCNIDITRRKCEKLIDSKATENVKRNRILDDGDITLYHKRIENYEKNNPNHNEFELHRINDDFLIPKHIWDRLYNYQHEAIKWMCDLHLKLCGGILGDEMGLGKTIEIIAFLITLSFSKSYELNEQYKYLGPVLLICPATVLYQWVNEFHKWWPSFRVAVLHQSGTYKGSNRNKLINDIIKTNGILITSYKSLVCFQKYLLPKKWHYIILDEGHKIRNPNAQVTQCCKLFETCHRLILSGTPIQNDLTELWSLMNFVYPNKLGTLETFMKDLGYAIKKGGYNHATEQEIQHSYNCSIILRDLIKPYLLRRTKDEIKNNLKLPKKNEQVLFCKLTEIQKKYYQDYINSQSFRRIDLEKASIFKALINIRKICNHPYLFSKECNPDKIFDKEFFKMSSKMVVINALLKLWYRQKQKVLIFTQGRQMLNLLERWVIKKKYSYFRMDGTTTINMRQNLIKTFNEDDEKFLFLLTTRVGGVGVSLTGANRVIIFDPDWNPCTDIQARERCWRIGQKRDVIIYRLMTSGTVEEKIYHRQIFKQYLSNRILRDPKHQKFVKMNNLRELFTLSDCSETGLYFYDSKVKLNRKKNNDKFNELRKNSSSSSMENKNLPKIPKKNSNNNNTIINNNNKSNLIDWSNVKIEISEERRRELREKVKKICQKQFDIKSNSINNDDDVLSSTTKIKDKNNVKDDKNKTDIQYIIDNCPNGVNVKILGENSGSKKNRNNNDDDDDNFINFEGHQIKYLVKKEFFNDKIDEDNDNKNKLKNKNEDYILGKIFGRSIDCILKHERIEYNPIPDHDIIENEAKELIKIVIKDLKQWIIAQKSNNNSDNNQIVKNKLANLIKPRIKFNNNQNDDELSSANLLKEKANKFILNNDYNDDNNNNMIKLSDKYQKLKLLSIELYKFIKINNNNYVSTDLLVNEFRKRIENNESIMFRELLINLATNEINYDNDNNDNVIMNNNRLKPNKYWKLKDEFINL